MDPGAHEPARAPVAGVSGALPLRAWGGAAHPAWRLLGAELNALSLLLFVLTVAAAARRKRPEAGSVARLKGV